jgi:hypothetical protein
VGSERGGEQRFMIKMGEEHVMCLLLSQKVYTCGECVVACIDFAGAARLCTKVVLSLESHETLLMQSASVPPPSTQSMHHPKKELCHCYLNQYFVCRILVVHFKLLAMRRK